MKRKKLKGTYIFYFLYLSAILILYDLASISFIIKIFILEKKTE